jgi:prepilin-type N-terminal cleavage/methylation domain-containing protein
MKQLNSRGFTIIELLISTVAFSVLLLIVTGAIIQFSKIYYKGVITSKTQEIARTITEDMAHSAQFMGNGPVGHDGDCYTFGSQRYNYIIGRVKTPDEPFVFKVDSGTTCSGAANPGAVELMGDNMQLLFIDATESADGKAVTITATVAYGSDVIINPSDRTKSTCPAISLGGQFCTVNTVKTTVTKRIGG